MKFPSFSRSILTLAIALATCLKVSGDPPTWWSDGEPPAWDVNAEPNNKGPANIGQAKWMASEALRALQAVDPSLSAAIRDDLTLPQPNPNGGTFPPILDFSVPDPKPPGWIEKQKSPLLIGQLKAIAAPFYTRLNALDSTWLANQRTANGTNQLDSIFPWTNDDSDDENKAMANVGQLKAVFSLHFDSLSPGATDSDDDGLSDAWELLHFGHLSFNGSEDPDGDGLSNRQEFEGNTNPSNPDTDNDGIPDSVDNDPLLSAIIFADADGDGIPDGDDAQPASARGPAPHVASETASGDPLVNLIKDENIKFVFSVSNPAGAAPTASNLTLFVNGGKETATITAIGSPVASSQRFVLAWKAKTTSNYPTLTLQNLTLRFRDSQKATSWIKLARIDVAEWEGMVAGCRAGPPSGGWIARIQSHSGGIKTPAHYLASMNGGISLWYRGSRNMEVLIDSGPSVLAMIGEDVRYPMVFLSQVGSSPPTLHSITDISDPDVIPHNGVWAFNNWSESIRISGIGAAAALPPGGNLYHAMPEQTEGGQGFVSVEVDELTSEGERPLSRSNWPTYTTQSSARLMTSVNFHTSNRGRATFTAVDCWMRVAAQIRPHATGPLEYPGLPLLGEYLPLGNNAWHKIILKAGPDAVAVSDGIGLWLRKGENGDTAPQNGYSLKVQGDNEALGDLAVPIDGKITLAANSPNWQRLMSPQGLTLFISRSDAVTDIHDFSIQLLKKREWHPQEALPIASIDLLPVEVALDVDRDGEITFDGKDKTTTEKPFRFWINNDQDDVEADEPSEVTTPDNSDAQIATKRDLEDFARIRLSVGLPLDQLEDGDWKVGLRFKAGSGQTPAIRVWPNESEAGEESYLDEYPAAERQIAKQSFGATSSGTVFIPSSYWQDRDDTEAHLIFEGISRGTGELALILLNGSEGSEIEAPVVHLKLLDVREMFQRARIVNAADEIPNPWIDDTPPAQSWVWDPWNWAYDEDPEAEETTAIFVHGWRLTYYEYLNWAQTSYKRLWHQGFKGKFYTFRWATLSGDQSSFEGYLTYNPSEYRSWLCGPALASWVNSLPNAGRRSLFGHSMGNVITGSALREGMSVQRYALCNAAMASMAYDSGAHMRLDPVNGEPWDKIWGDLGPQKTPDTDTSAAIRDSFGLEGKFSGGNNFPQMINFYLPDDDALKSWIENNRWFKPDSTGHSYYYQHITQPPNIIYKLFHAPPAGNPREVTSPPEAFGYVTKALTRAAGTDSRTGGSIGSSVNMNDWGVGANHSGFGVTHSAQWRWSNQSTSHFWDRLCEELQLVE